MVHTLELAEQLHARGSDVTVVALGDPAVGFFRPVSAPCSIVAAPAWAESLDERVFRWIDALEDGLARLAGVDDAPGGDGALAAAGGDGALAAASGDGKASGDGGLARASGDGEAGGPGGGRFGILHAQDCISARAACRVRDRMRRSGTPLTVVRTVHHVDDFSTQALIDCQAAAIAEPDRVLVVSEAWRRRLMHDYGVRADVVTNGVRAERFGPSAPSGARGGRAARRASIGAAGRHLFLTVGGIEPRKGTEHLVKALSLLRREDAGADDRRGGGHTESRGGAPPAMLAVVGGHSFRDYRDYRERVLGSLGSLGLTLGEDVVLLGTVPHEELPGWFAAADGFVFPSVEEGWGLVVLEALAAGLPAVTSDIEVFGEFLRHEHDAILTRAGDPASLAEGMARLRDDSELADRLRANGPVTAGRYPWSATARQHEELYRACLARRHS